MTARFLPGAPARACGFAAGWSFFTAILLLATRPMGIGPGFSHPLPYAGAAILLSVSGHLIRRWLGDSPVAAEAGPGGALRRLGREWLHGFRLFLKGPAAFNNFILLSVAYCIGIGLTSLFIRKRNGGKPEGEAPATTYWRDLAPGKRDGDAYYRPY
jgi:hypothetical protein